MDVLIIDEVSMVRADLMDAIAASLRINTNNHLSPFAEKTIVFVGDMHQLPPIVATSKEKQLFQERYDTPYFFSAESLTAVLQLLSYVAKISCRPGQSVQFSYDKRIAFSDESQSIVQLFAPALGCSGVFFPIDFLASIGF